MSARARSLAIATLAGVAIAQQAPTQAHVFGRVVDQDGNAVAAAEVELRRSQREGLPPFLRCGSEGWEEMRTERSSRTDAHGKFALEVQPWGEYELVAHKGEELRSRPRRPIAPGQVVTLTALPQIERHGRVLVERAGQPPVPAAGARVCVMLAPEPTGLPMSPAFMELPSLLAELTADAEGRFAVRVPRPTQAIALARLGTRTRWVRWTDAEEIAITLPADKSSLSGVVVDAQGTPIRGSRVGLVADPVELARTDAAGEFRVDVGPQPTVLEIQVPGCLPAMVPAEEVAAHAGGDALRIVIPDQPQWRARLLRADGSPLARSDVILAANPVWGQPPIPRRWSATTADDGRLDLRGGSSDLQLWARGAEGWRALGQFAAGHGVELGDFRIDDDMRLRGSVVDADGAPAAGAAVIAVPAAPQVQSCHAYRRVFTDHAGRFELHGLGPGLHRVGAVSVLSKLSVVSAEAGDDPEPITLALERALTIDGVVRDRRGCPLAGALVQGLPMAGAAPDEQGELAMLTHACALTGDDGSFRLACRRSVTEWSLTAQGPLGSDIGPGFREHVRPGTRDLEIQVAK